MQILDGKTTSATILQEIKAEIASVIEAKKCRAPRIDIILIGNDYASEQYVGMKQKKASETGINGQIHRLNENVSQSEVLALVEQLNAYDDVDGFMVQLPIPAHLDTQIILDAIDVSKDVDGLSAKNLGGVLQGAEWAIPSATAKGVMDLLKSYEIQIVGKKVVVLGRSKAVGLPLYGLLLNADANVTLLHSRSGSLEDVAKMCKEADILISAIGRANYVDANFVKEGAVVVDVGTNKNTDGKLCGDVDFEAVKNIVSYISPVPGGAGPMTIAALLGNVFKVWKDKFES